MRLAGIITQSRQDRRGRKGKRMIRVEVEYERGKQAGAAEIASGRPQFYWQTRGFWGELLTKLMADRFSVVVRHTSDITSYAEASFRSGYNSTIAEWVNQKFGEGSFESVLSEVERYREQQARDYLDIQQQGSP
jgi:hypothetical protein